MLAGWLICQKNTYASQYCENIPKCILIVLCVSENINADIDTYMSCLGHNPAVPIVSMGKLHGLCLMRKACARNDCSGAWKAHQGTFGYAWTNHTVILFKDRQWAYHCKHENEYYWIEYVSLRFEQLDW